MDSPLKPEDDEQPPLKKARKLVKKVFDTIDADEVMDLNGQIDETIENNTDGVIDGEEEQDDGDDVENEEYYQQYRFMGHSRQGLEASAEELREAQEIFGEGLDELDAEEEEVTPDATKDTTVRASYEYFQQLQTFSLAADEEIRNADFPERFHFAFDGIRDLKVDREIEAMWIVRKLQEQAKSRKIDFSDVKSQELLKSIPIILEMIHVDNLEIPTIWLYKKDYLPKQQSKEDAWDILTSRTELWDIFWLDIKFRTLEKEKLISIEVLAQLEEKASVLIDSDEQHNVLGHIAHLKQIIEFSANDDATEFAISSIPMVVQRLQSGVERASVRNKSLYGQFAHIHVVRRLVNALIAPAHSVGKALKNDLDLDVSPTNISSSFQEFVASLLTSETHSPNDGEISRLSSAALNVAAKEISYDPLVRSLAKKYYLEEGTLSTKPTERGLSELSPFSEYFGFQSLRRKPLRDFCNTEGLLFFMRILDAEGKGLITVEFQNPFKEMGQTSRRHSSMSFFSDRIFKYIVQSSSPDSVISEEAKSSFDEARLLLFEKLMGDNIAPLAIKDTKAELLKLGREIIMKQAGDSFEAKLKVGPFPGKFAAATKNLQIAGLLLDCPNRPRCQRVVGMFISPDHGSIDAVCVDTEGGLVSTCLMPTMLTTDWEEKLKLFLFDHKPDSIVLNSSGREKTIRVKSRIEEKIIQDVNEALRISSSSMSGQYDEDERSPETFSVEIAIFDDEIPTIFMRSTRAKEMYPELAPTACAALSLARMAIEPLLEFCSLWKGVDSFGSFGFEAMYLKLHPLQDMIKHEKKALLQYLEMKVVQAVSDVGVDLHLATRHRHYATMLAFLPGLGLRKAEKLIRDIARHSNKVTSRFALHDEELFLSANVWTNSCGFMRLSQKLGYQRFNPLDNTRIHPVCYEVYDFVRRICADALDVENKPESQMQIIADVRSNIRKTIERYFIPDKDGIIKWERVLETVEYGSSVVADGGFSRKYKEIKDALEALVLTEFADEIEALHKGKRLFELEMIKDELRYPWLDLRKYNYGYSREEFSSYVRGESLTSMHLGQRVAVKIKQIQDNRSPFLMVMTEDGLRGAVSEADISDERREFKYEELCSMFSLEERRIGVVVGLRFPDRLAVSFRPSVCARSESWWMRNRTNDAAQDERNWWTLYCNKRGTPSNLGAIFDPYFDEVSALAAFEELEKESKALSVDQSKINVNMDLKPTVSQFDKIDQSVRFHPFFVNMSATDAENYLNRRIEEKRISIPAVIRPSSKGPTHLAIVWAFRPGQFMHIRVEQVSNPRDASRPLFVVDHPSSNRPFADIDEIFSEYIGRMHDYASNMIKHKNFHPGRQADVESDMRRQVTENPDRIAYFLRYEDNTPGVFAITWMDKTFTCRAVKILVTNSGFEIGKRAFTSPSEIVGWLKRSSVPEPPKAVPLVRRQSRFT